MGSTSARGAGERIKIEPAALRCYDGRTMSRLSHRARNDYPSCLMGPPPPRREKDGRLTCMLHPDAQVVFAGWRWLCPECYERCEMKQGYKTFVYWRVRSHWKEPKRTFPMNRTRPARVR